MSLKNKLRSWARQMKRDGVTLWFACRNPRTPLMAKSRGVFVVAYALSPIDLVPDFIPVLGFVDDVLLLPALIWLAIRLIPDRVLVECRRHADKWLAEQGKRPTSMWGIALVIVAWLLAATAIWWVLR